MVRVHDVVVIGAGPGGSATAHFLSARGLETYLPMLQMRRKPGVKLYTANPTTIGTAKT